MRIDSFGSSACLIICPCTFSRCWIKSIGGPVPDPQSQIASPTRLHFSVQDRSNTTATLLVWHKPHSHRSTGTSLCVIANRIFPVMNRQTSKKWSRERHFEDG